MTRRGTTLAAWAVIVATGLLCAAPLVIQDGWRTYQDNPCHLAVLDDLAHGHGGWSDAAFLGFPAAAIHSPFWYGLLGRLTAWGVPAGLLLALFDLAGFLAPALAVLTVVRRRAPLWAATAAAWLVLVQRPWLAGFESPLGGMATFGLASACLVLILGELSREEATPRRLAILGALYALLGSTHLFLILPAVLAFVVAGVLDRRRVARRLAAAGLGALASAPYWLPALVNRSHLVIQDQPMPPHLGLLYLVLPLHPLDLADGRLHWLTDLAFTDAAPMVLLLVLGLAGIRAARADRQPRLAVLLAVAIALLVLVAVPLSGAPLAGPHSWRRLFLVRLALAIPAAHALAAWPPLVRAARRPRTIAITAVLLVVSGLWWQRPLRHQTPPPESAGITDLAHVWNRLRDRLPAPGDRLYVQDTFYLAGRDTDLFHSHLPALTARETGWPQVGAFYGGMPLVTESWTGAQFGQLFGRPLLDADDLLRVGRLIPDAGVSHLLLSNPTLAAKMIATGLYREDFKHGRFTVITPAVDDRAPAAVAVRRREPGLLDLEIHAGRSGRRAAVNTAWAPGWRVEGATGITTRPGPDGRIELAGIPAGPSRATLRYRAPRWPLLPAALGWLGLLALALPRRR